MLGKLLALTLFAAPALANDSEAGVAGGQLVLKRSEDIVMLSEALFLSQSLVTVDYQFKNEGKKDVDTTVAFPLPKICSAVSGEKQEIEEPLALDPYAADPLKFVVTIDGKTKPAALERKVSDDKKRSERCFELTYYWQQKFPAGKVVKVHHRYVPANDGFFLPIGKDLERYAKDPNEKQFVEGLRKEACIDDSLFATLKSKGGDNQLASARLLRYVLKTGAHWKGKIGSFKLRIKKDLPAALVSLCWQGLKKTSATTFEATRTDFEPEADLAVLFLDLPK